MGTRLLDVSTSLLFALLFACVDWKTGQISCDTDGVVYLFCEGQNAVVHNYLKETIPTANEFFNSPHSTNHVVINPPHNERSKAQSGGFIWWRKFWASLTGLPYLRVPKEHKEKVVREHLAFGVGPKEAVRGNEGLILDEFLRKSLS